MSSNLDIFEIFRPHVLRCVHPDALHPEAGEVIDESGNLASDVIAAAVEVVETDQVAVTNLGDILVVADLAVGLVEVRAGVGNSRVVLATSVEVGTSDAFARAKRNSSN